MSHGQRILIVDDDPLVGESLAEFCAREGLAPEVAPSAEEAIRLLREGDAAGSAFAIAICDLSLPGMDGLELAREIAKSHTRTAPIILTGYGTIESAVEAIRRGAFDYLSKPIVDTELRLVLERALRQQTLLEENTTLKKQLGERFALGTIIGGDYRMVKAFEIIDAAAQSKATFLMTG